jgi:hemerythrin-like domain-containing protein
MTSALNLHATPSAGFDEPFEMLVACHQRVERMLDLLERLAQHLLQSGNDAGARQAAVDVMRYFDLAGPAHHEDEERYLFPALRTQGDATLQTLVARLQQDHVDMARQWGDVRADLQAVRAAGLVDQGAGARWAAFAALYRGHIQAEERDAYPAARALLDGPACAVMAQEMARRRGAAWPAP